jgi:hypothetical protein
MYYWVLVGVYYVAAGFAYLVCIVVPSSLSQLVGVVTIFANAMFAGGAPVLKQLQAVGCLYIQCQHRSAHTGTIAKSSSSVAYFVGQLSFRCGMLCTLEAVVLKHIFSCARTSYTS